MRRRRVVAMLGIGVLVALFAGLVAHAMTPAVHVPSFAEVRAGWRPSDLRLLDRDGAVLHEVRVDETRRRLGWTALADVAPALQAAILASEDRRFYRHRGVDLPALAAAAARGLGGGPRRGASTISMQVASLIDETRPRRRAAPRTAWQKWRQMRQAWALEARWSKREILEAYLNLLSFRGELQGVASAASVLFGKAPHGLTEAEALVLAVLVRGPGADAETVARRAWSLRRAQEQDVARASVDGAVARVFARAAGAAPRVADAEHAARRLLRAGRHTSVPSSLDGTLQRLASDVLRRQLLAVRGERVHDGAVLVVDNATGEVLAYVGSSGDLSLARHVDGIQARRQPGSALKPFLYALALDRRLVTPASLLEDAPLDVPVAGGVYRPRNYDDGYHGLVTVRTALASSLNVPAVRTLGLVGEDAFVTQLRALGFEGLGEAGDFYGPSLALGSADVSLWELTNAYRALANGGVWSPLTLERAAARREFAGGRRVYSAAAAFMVSDILADRESRSATFGLVSPLATRSWSAVKTGTSKDMRDNWCVGYSRRHTVGVWVGNFSGQSMRNVSGVTGAAPVWLEVMEALQRGAGGAAPPAPAGVVARAVELPRGVEPSRSEWFLRGTEPAGPTRTAHGAQPRIVYPADGAIVAVDPEIPASRQRLAFEAADAGPSFRFTLDGADLGSAAEPALWAPRRGTHVLALVDPAQQVRATVKFVVR